jgi:hypothetical protein
MSALSRPHLPWSAGQRLVPPADGTPESTVIGLPPFITRAEVGQITAGTGSWFLDLGLASRADAPLDLTAHGIAVSHLTRAPHPLLLLTVPEAGVLMGEADAGQPISLQSPDGEIVRTDGLEVVELPEAVVSLRSVRHRDRIRFTLLYDPTAQADFQRVVRRWSDTNPARWLDAALAPYDAFWRRQAGLPGPDAVLLAENVRALMADLRPAAGPLSLPWVAARSQRGSVFSTNQLFPLVLAWIQIRPRMAMNLVKNVIGNQRVDGSVPALLRPDGRHDIVPTPAPLLAHCALRVWRAEPNRDFFDFAFPALQRYVRWALRYFDPDDRALPHWQEPDEAYVPGTHDAQLVSADLVSFLIGEIDALVEMGSAVTVGGGDLADLLAYRERLLDTLVRFLWDEAAGAFRDRYIDGPHIARMTLAAAVPVRIAALAADFRAPVLSLLQRSDSLRSDNGLRAWVPWDSDAETPPVLAAHQVMMWDTLSNLAEPGPAGELRTVLLQNLRANHRLASPGAGPGEAGAEDPALSSALTVLLLARPGDPMWEGPELAGLFQWMQDHPRIVTGAIVSVVALVLGGIILGSCTRRLMTLQTMETTAGLARRHYADGKMQDAERLYRDVIDSGRYFPGVYHELGNTLHRQERWAEAEANYRLELAKRPDSPAALFNLGLTLYRAQATSNAVEVWQQVTNQYSVRSPKVAERAATALQLLQEAP